MLSEDSFQYAIENTRVVRAPEQRIQTFGSTSFRFFLVSELMDSVNKVRVRDGQLHAERPALITPEYVREHLLEGFGEKAHEFLGWLEDHTRDLAATLDGRNPDPERSARFVRAFVRPRGLETPATMVFVEELEALAARPTPTPLPVPVWTHPIRLILKPFADAAARRILLMEELSRRRSQERLEEHRRNKLPQLMEYRQKKAEEASRRKEELAGAVSSPEDAP